MSAIYQLAALIIPGPTVRNLETTSGWLETFWLDRVDDDAWLQLCRRYRERQTSFDVEAAGSKLEAFLTERPDQASPEPVPAALMPARCSATRTWR